MRSVFSSLFFAVLTAAFSAVAEPGDLARFAGKIRAGAEIELTPTQFSRIVQAFDVSTLNADKANVPAFEKFMNQYLDSDDGEAFQALPETVRRELAGDLKLEGDSKLVMPNGRKPGDARLILPGSAPESAPNSAMDPQRIPDKSAGGILLTERQTIDLNWETLRDRWRNLPDERKLELMDLDHFPAEWKAQTLVAYMRAHQSFSPTLKESAAPGIKKVLGNYNWSVNPRQNLIEFRHTEPYENPADMEASRAQLAKYTLTTKAFNDLNVPEDGGVTYHFHVSVKDPGNAAEFTELAETYNALLLMRLAVAGRAEDALKPEAQVAYGKSIREKGLIRLVANGRIEQRVHLKEPADSLAELAALLLKPRREAIAEMRQELRTHVEAGRLDDVSRHDTESARRVLSFTYGRGPELQKRLAEQYRAGVTLAGTVEQRFSRTLELVEAISRYHGETHAAAFEVLPETQTLLLAGNGRELLMKWLTLKSDGLLPLAGTDHQPKMVLWYLSELLKQRADLHPFFHSPEFVSAVAEIAEAETGSALSVAANSLAMMAERFPETGDQLTERFLAGKTLPDPALRKLFTEKNLRNPAFVEAMSSAMGGGRDHDAARVAVRAYALSDVSEPTLDAAYRKGFGELVSVRQQNLLIELATAQEKQFPLPSAESFRLTVGRVAIALDSPEVKIRGVAISQLFSLAEARPNMARLPFAVLANLGANPADAVLLMAETNSAPGRRTLPALTTYLNEKAPESPLMNLLRTGVPPKAPAPAEVDDLINCKFHVLDLGGQP